MMLPGIQPARAGQFAGMQPQQGGRGAINGTQQILPNAFGIPGQMPFGPIPQGGPGGFPNGMGYNQALAQVQAQLGRGNQGGRGQMQGIPGVQSIPQQIMPLGGMRGRDGRAPYPTQPARGGMGINAGMQSGQMGGAPQPGRGPMVSSMGPPGGIQPGPTNNGPSNLDVVTTAPSSQQKQLLGEALYPKIQLLQPELAGKVTGMLLEMDYTELIGL